MWKSLIGLILVLALAACRDAAPPADLSTQGWLELVPGDGMELRAVTEGPRCPAASVDGAALTLSERAAPTADFPVRVCTAAVPRAARAITLAGQALPVLAPRIDRIVVIGDTGCRLKGAYVQSCDDPVAWPFATVTARAAARHPDLVIHVGDYHYRETACPPGDAGCRGSPSGDNWAVWSADFFAPAKPLLAAAPWVVARGNHELCGRGGKGWFRLLDPAPTILDCPVVTDAYAIHLDGLNLGVLDSAAAEDPKPTPALVPHYAEDFRRLAGDFGTPFWIVTHRPVWGVAPLYGAEGAETGLAPLNATLQAAIDPAVPPTLGMVMSGHVHSFASFDFGKARPAQLVVGVGGSTYDQLQIPPAGGPPIDGLRPAAAFALTHYGYVVLERAGSGWNGTFYAAEDDRVLATCSLGFRTIACR